MRRRAFFPGRHKPHRGGENSSRPHGKRSGRDPQHVALSSARGRKPTFKDLLLPGEFTINDKRHHVIVNYTPVSLGGVHEAKACDTVDFSWQPT